MDVLRTPDERFADLPGYPWTPSYAETSDGLRMAYVDEGAGPVVLLLHGEPSWSYLYRHMIPPLVDAGFRVIAPDLIGFGRSDKPSEPSDYTYARHMEWLRSVLFDALDLTDVVLVCQDWGGLLGLRMVAEHPDRFVRVVAQWDRPFLCAFSDQDPITAGGERMLIGKIPGAKDQPHTTITGGGHFLQEDRGPELAKVVIDWIQGS